MLDQRPTRDRHAWSETVMPKRRPTALIRDPLKTDIPIKRPYIIPVWKLIKNYIKVSIFKYICLNFNWTLQARLSPMGFYRHVGLCWVSDLTFWSSIAGRLVPDYICWSLMRHIGLWWGILVSDASPSIGMSVSNGSPMGLR